MVQFKSEGDKRRYYLRATALIIVRQTDFTEKRLTEGSIYDVVKWSFVTNTCGFRPSDLKKDKK